MTKEEALKQFNDGRHWLGYELLCSSDFVWTIEEVEQEKNRCFGFTPFSDDSTWAWYVAIRNLSLLQFLFIEQSETNEVGSRLFNNKVRILNEMWKEA